MTGENCALLDFIFCLLSDEISFWAPVVQPLSCVWLFVTPWTAARQASLSITNSRSLLRLMSTESVMPSNQFIPLLSSSAPAFSLSQHQGLFKWISSSHQVAKVLEFQLQHPMNIQDWFPLGWTGWISLQSKGLSRVFSNTTVWKHQFFGTQLSLKGPTLTSIHDCWKNHGLD